MLKVTENSVNPTGETRERFVAPDFSAGAREIARGAEGLAAGINAATSDLDKIGEMYDEAAVKEADAQDLRRISEIRARVVNSQGFEAQTEIEKARQEIQQIRKERVTSLHNNRQRRMYTDVFDQRNLQLEETFANHGIKQTMEASKAASVARAETYMDLARDTFGTDAFEENLGTALNEISAANRGAPPEAIARKRAEVRSKVIGGAISSMFADPDRAEEAALMLDKHAADILPDDEEKIRRQLNPILDENRTDADAGWAFTGDGAPTETAPQPNTAAPSSGASYSKPVIPADPLRGKGRITETAAGHRQRGSGNALDIAAPAGTAIHPPMSGKVVKSWWDEKGGWSILVEHPNGYVTGYAHMRSKSPLDEGAEVDADTVIGSVGSTGKSTGPHVHYTVRQSRGGPKVDPSAVLWDGRSVKPDSVAWKEQGIQKYTADENSLGRALSRLHDRATAENWSPRRYEKAVSRVRQIAGVQDQLYNQQQEDRYNAAIEKVVELGDKFTSISQIPGYGLLKGSQKYSLMNIAEGNRKAAAGGEGGAGKANGERFLTLMGMARSPEFRQQFLSVDLGNETVITPGERARLWNMQLEMKKDPHGPLAANLGKADFFARRYLGSKQFSDAKRQQFADRFMAVMGRQQGDAGRPLDDRELDNIARGLVTEVARDGKSSMAFELPGSGQGGTINIPDTFNRIPLDQRQAIIQKLQREKRPTSPREIVKEFLSATTR